MNDISSQTFDLIVIGSGISALTLAALQSRHGKRVLVLEKHYVAGGFTHTFKRKGYEWNSGLHYLGEVHYKKNPMRKIFDYISEEKIDWAPMAEAYDTYHYPDRTYSFRAGKDNFKEEILKSFPGAGKVIDQYLALVRAYAGQIQLRSGIKLSPQWVEKLIVNKEVFADKTYDVISRITKDEKLISVLCSLWGDYGQPPKMSSFAVHAVIANHYMNGGAYPVGGSSQIAKHIVATIEKYGGTVMVSSGVQKILVRHNTAYGVKLEDGREIQATKVVSSAGVHKTYLDLFAPEDLPNGVLKKAQYFNPSSGYLSIALGFKESSDLLNHTGSNIWIYPGYDHDENVRRYLENPKTNPPPMNYISFPSIKDPTWKTRIGDNTAIDIIGGLPFEWVEKWKATTKRSRPDEYKELKEELSQPYLEGFYRIFPQFKGKLDYSEVSTPLSVKHYMNYRQGEIYGLALEPARFQDTFLRPSTPIQNFYLTGQDVLMNGVCGAMMSGVLTSIQVAPFQTLGQVLPLGIF